jgi:hypothetical protein
MTALASHGTGADPEPGPDSGIDEGREPEPDFEIDEGLEPELRPQRRVGPLAIMTTIVFMLVLAAGAYAVATHNFKPKPKVMYRPAAIFSLRMGECFNSSQNGVGATVLPCAKPHQAEVFATFQLPGSSWPGTDAVQAQADAGCASRLASYMNPQLASTALDQEAIYPDQVTWQASVRTVVCDVRSNDGLITGSVHQAS